MNKRELAVDSGSTPEPLNRIARGRLVPLSLTTSVPVLDVELTGLNVMSIEQLAPAARIVPQLLDCWKIDVVVMLVMFRGLGLLLLKVAVRVAVVPM